MAITITILNNDKEKDKEKEKYNLSGSANMQIYNRYGSFSFLCQFQLHFQNRFLWYNRMMQPLRSFD